MGCRGRETLMKNIPPIIHTDDSISYKAKDRMLTDELRVHSLNICNILLIRPFIINRYYFLSKCFGKKHETATTPEVLSLTRHSHGQTLDMFKTLT